MSQQKQIETLVEIETLLRSCSQDGMRTLLLSEKKRIENDLKHARRSTKQANGRKAMASQEDPRTTESQKRGPGRRGNKREDRGANAMKSMAKSHHEKLRHGQHSHDFQPTTTSLKEERRKYDDQNRKETEKQGTNRSRSADIFCDAKYESRGKEGTSRKKQHQKKGVKIGDVCEERASALPRKQKIAEKTAFAMHYSPVENLSSTSSARTNRLNDKNAIILFGALSNDAKELNALDTMHPVTTSKSEKHRKSSRKGNHKRSRQYPLTCSEMNTESIQEPKTNSFKQRLDKRLESNHISLKSNHFEDSRQTNGKQKPVSSTIHTKAATWKAISPQKPMVRGAASSDMNESSSKQYIPRLDHDRETTINVSSSSSTISLRLMRLREDGPLQPTVDQKVHGNEQAIAHTTNKSTSVKKKSLKLHKVLQRQKSLPAELEETKTQSTMSSIQYLDTTDFQTVKKKQDFPSFTKQTAVINQTETKEVVFHVDLDDLHEQQQKQNKLSFFNPKMVRRRSIRDTKDAATMLQAWEIPHLMKQQEMQTQAIEVTAACTQTMVTTKEVSSQTIFITTSDSAIQAEAKRTQMETQTENEATTSGTQTEDEDSPVWGLRNKLSLDKLVMCHGKRHKMTRNSSIDELHNTAVTSIDTSSEKTFRRAVTLPHGRKDDYKFRKQKITSYNWTQTEKFIKITVSYSGVHLISTKSIKVFTNGINLRVKILKNHVDELSNNEGNEFCSKEMVAGELHIPMLSHLVSGLSYTVQCDMLTVLLRKQNAEHWKTLEFQSSKAIPDHAI